MNDHKVKGRFAGKQFCIHGHDTYKVGRNTQRFCRECSRSRTERRRNDPVLYQHDLAYNRRKMNKKYRTDPAYRAKIQKRVRDSYRQKILGLPPQPPLGTPCEICGKGRDKFLRPDHDHNTQQFRGWLCAKCNSGIALLGDTLIGVHAAATYMDSVYAS